MGLGAGCSLNFVDSYIRVVISCARNEQLVVKLEEENNGPFKRLKRVVM